MTGEPATTAILVTSIVGTGVAAYGTYQQGQQAAQQARSQAAWNRYNAQLADREKQVVREQSRFKADKLAREKRAFQARNRAAAGAAGVEFEGSPLLVAEDNAAQFTREELNIRQAGARGIQSLESRSILDTFKAKAASSSAKGFARAGAIGAGAGLLQGGANTAFMAHQMGLFDKKPGK
jgi:hypothetical protein